MQSVPQEQRYSSLSSSLSSSSSSQSTIMPTKSLSSRRRDFRKFRKSYSFSNSNVSNTSSNTCPVSSSHNSKGATPTSPPASTPTSTSTLSTLSTSSTALKKANVTASTSSMNASLSSLYSSTNSTNSTNSNMSVGSDTNIQTHHTRLYSPTSANTNSNNSNTKSNSNTVPVIPPVSPKPSPSPSSSSNITNAPRKTRSSSIGSMNMNMNMNMNNKDGNVSNSSGSGNRHRRKISISSQSSYISALSTHSNPNSNSTTPLSSSQPSSLPLPSSSPGKSNSSTAGGRFSRSSSTLRNRLEMKNHFIKDISSDSGSIHNDASRIHTSITMQQVKKPPSTLKPCNHDLKRKVSSTAHLEKKKFINPMIRHDNKSHPYGENNSIRSNSETEKDGKEKDHETDTKRTNNNDINVQSTINDKQNQSKTSIHKPEISTNATNTNNDTTTNSSSSTMTNNSTTKTNTKTTRNDEFTYSNLHSMWLQRDNKLKNINIKVRPPTATSPVQLKISKSPLRQRLSVIRNKMSHISRSGSTSHNIHVNNRKGNDDSCKGQQQPQQQQQRHGGVHVTSQSVDDDKGKVMPSEYSKDCNNDSIVENRNQKDASNCSNEQKLMSNNDHKSIHGHGKNMIDEGANSNNNDDNQGDNYDAIHAHVDAHTHPNMTTTEGQDSNDVKEENVVNVKSVIRSLQHALESTSASTSVPVPSTTASTSSFSSSSFRSSSFRSSSFKTKTHQNCKSLSESLSSAPKTNIVASKSSKIQQPLQQQQQQQQQGHNEEDENQANVVDVEQENNDCSYNEEITTLLFKTNSNALPFDDELDEKMQGNQRKSKYECNVGYTSGKLPQDRHIDYDEEDNDKEEHHNEGNRSFESATSELLPRRLMDLSLTQSEKEAGFGGEYQGDLIVAQNKMNPSESINDERWVSGNENPEDKGQSFKAAVSPSSIFDPFNEVVMNEDDNAVRHQWDEISFESLASVGCQATEKFGISTEKSEANKDRGESPSLVETTLSTSWSQSFSQDNEISSSFSNQNTHTEDPSSNVFEPFSSLDTMISNNKEDMDNADASILSWQERSFESMGNNNNYVEVEESGNQKDFVAEVEKQHSNHMHFDQVSTTSNQLIEVTTPSNSGAFTTNFIESNSAKIADPYVFYDSMSTANSEITVRIENKLERSAEKIVERSLLGNKQISSCKQQAIGFQDIQTFDCNDENESTIPDSAFGISQSETKSEPYSTSSLNLRTLAGQQKEILSKTGSVGGTIYGSGLYTTEDEDENDDNIYDYESHASNFSFPSHLACPLNGQKALSDSGTDVFDGISSVAGPSAASSSILSMDLFTKSFPSFQQIQDDTLMRSSIVEEDLTGSKANDGTSSQTMKEDISTSADEKRHTLEENDTSSPDKSIQTDKKYTSKVQRKRFGKYLANLASKAKPSNITRAWRGAGNLTNKDLNNDTNHDSRTVGISRPPLPEKLSVESETTWTKEQIIEDINQRSALFQHSDHEKVPETKEDEKEKTVVDYECAPIEDIKAKIGWIPSMIRLYEKKMVNPADQTLSPNIATEIVNENPPGFEPTIAECQLAGTQFLQLNSTSRYIGEPSLHLKGGDFYRPLRKKLRQFLVKKNFLYDRNVVRKSRPGLFEKTLETHERVLALLVVSKEMEQ